MVKGVFTQKKSILARSRFKRKKEKIRRSLLSVLLPIAGIVSISVGILFLPYTRITEIVVEGNNEEINNTLQSFVVQKISGSILKVLPANSIFFIRTNHLHSKIIETYHNIVRADLSYVFGFPPMLHVAYEERTSVGIYCAENYDELNSGSCFYIDITGMLFETAPHIRGQAITRFIKHSTTTVSVGSKIVAPETMQTLMQMITTIKEKTSFRIYEVMIDMEYENEIVFRTSEHWDIRFDAREDGTHALENLFLVLNDRLTNRENLQYVDIRLPQKVFYKYDDEQ